VDNPGYTGFPSSDPYITEVGGTTLSTTGPGGAYTSETVWNWGLVYGPFYDGIGSSGGVSSYYAIPWWQTNINADASGGSTTFRNTPDVALTADNVFVIASGGVQYPGVGGTSCAAPLWAGFTALVNQQAVNVGHAPVGFLNPALYALAKSQYYTNVFNDTTTGNNTWSASPTKYFAVTNYDLCTGLGTPKGTNLIAALTSVTNVYNIGMIMPPPPGPYVTNLSVMNGANPNGLWMLYIQDDKIFEIGTNYNGWFVNLTTANPVGFAADNQLYVNATNVTVNLGAHWITTLAVTNYGPSLSSNVFVADSLPDAPGVTLVSSNLTVGSITNYGSTLIWNLGNLPANAGGTLTLNFLANSPGIYTNGAVVGATTLDPNPDDDSIGVVANVIVSTSPVIVPYFPPGGGGGFQLSVTGAAASTVIQASTNLLTWIPVYTNIPPFTYTNYDSTNYMMRFYRAVVGP
jgi:subtilase family serine protease